MAEPRTVQGLPLGEDRALRGLGGDPLAAALTDHPYNLVPELGPEHGMRAILTALQRMQRRAFDPRQDAALRTLRDLPSRLAWDLQTLGTTPEVSPEEWARVRHLLVAGRREEAALVLGESGSGPRSKAALHVRAVLAANEAVWQAANEGVASEGVMSRLVARWAALLWREDWLAFFASHRCHVWRVREPDAADVALFREQAEQVALERIERGAGPDRDRRSRWLAAWEQERAAIQVVARSCGKRSSPPAWPAGYGPLGLADLGERESAEKWLLKSSQANRWPLPLSALQEGKAGFFKLDAEQTAIAAAAVQRLFSCLGPAAAEVWNGNGRAAAQRLQGILAERAGAGGETEDPWFGPGAAGRQYLARAAKDLSVEALLLQVQEELSRPEVPVQEVAETAGTLLYQAASLEMPQVIAESLESLLVGRLQACTDQRRLPHPDEVQRILGISSEVRSMLLGRGAGQRCGKSIALLLKMRAVAAWNRSGGSLPRPAVQERALRDLFRAAELAPHRADIATNLARVILQIHHRTGSRAEQESLLRRGLEVLDRCAALGSATTELEESRLQLREMLDPEAARSEALRQLEAALGGESASPLRTKGSGHAKS